MASRCRAVFRFREVPAGAKKGLYHGVGINHGIQKTKNNAKYRAVCMSVGARALLVHRDRKMRRPQKTMTG